MNIFSRARRILEKENIDTWIISSDEDSDPHSAYILGVKAHSKHYILINRKGPHKILIGKMERAMIQKMINPINFPQDDSFQEIQILEYNSMGELMQYLISNFQKNVSDVVGEKTPVKKIAMNFGENILFQNGTGYADYMTTGEYFTLHDLCMHGLTPEEENKYQIVSAAPVIKGLREIKTPEEHQDLRECVKATIEILENVPNWVIYGGNGMTEREVQARLEYEYGKVGGDIPFDAIIANGKHSADPHHNSSSKKIKEGCLLIDSGMRLDKMCSDITWMYWLGKGSERDPPEHFNNAYNALIDSRNEAKKYLVEGEKNNRAAIECRNVLANAGYDHEKLFIHGLGHSLGYEVHDIGGRISSKVSNAHILKKGMVYSNEPGLYWQGKYGIRLETDVIIQGKDQNVEECGHIPKQVIRF